MMAKLTDQQKDARERILTMALLSGLTASDLVSIGGRLKRQQERNILISKSQELHQMTWQHGLEGYTVTHNGKTITAQAIKDNRKDRTWRRERYEIKVVGPKGGVKYHNSMTLSDYDIDNRWPQKLMVNRDRELTALLMKINSGEIPT
jgi:hypothetical protein